MDYNNLDKQSYKKGYKDGKQDAAYEIITQMRYINGSLGYEKVEDYPDYLTAFLDGIAKEYNVEEDEVH